MIATVAAPRERIALGQTLEVGTGHVIEQKIVLQREEFTEPTTQMLLQRPLVRQQAIQRAVQTIVVDPLNRQSKQIFQGGGAVPSFGDVQFARRLKQSGDDQYRRHLRPRNRFPALRHQLCAQFLQFEHAPQLPSQPDPAEPARALQADSIESYRDALLIGRGCFKQFPLLVATADVLRQQPALARPAPSSSPNCATVSWSTFPPRRIERTSRQ